MKHTYLISWYGESASRMHQLVGHHALTINHKLKATDIPIIQKDIRAGASLTLHDDPIILNINELASERWWNKWAK